MKTFLRLFCMLLMYAALFVAAFGVISYFTGVVILSNPIYQLFIGIGAFALAVVLFIIVYSQSGSLTDDEDEDEEEEDIEAELQQVAQKAERNEDDNNEYTDDTTVLTTTGIIRMAVENAQREVEEEQKALNQASETQQEVAVSEAKGEDVKVIKLDEMLQQNVVDLTKNTISEDELVETSEISIAEIEGEEEKPEINMSLFDDEIIETTEVSVSEVEEAINENTETVLENKTETEEVEIEEVVEEESEEETLVVDESNEQEAVEETTIEENETTKETVDQQEIVDEAEEENECVEETSKEADLELSKTSLEILNTVDAGFESASTQELATLETEANSSIEYQPVIDSFINAVDNLENGVDEKVRTIDVIEAKKIPDGLTNTQVIYIEGSENSYINDEGLPQLKITNEYNVKDIDMLDEEYQRLKELERRKAEEIAKAEAEALRFEQEEKQHKVVVILVTIMVLLIVAIAGVVGFYLTSRKLI